MIRLALSVFAILALASTMENEKWEECKMSRPYCSGTDPVCPDGMHCPRGENCSNGCDLISFERYNRSCLCDRPRYGSCHCSPEPRRNLHDSCYLTSQCLGSYVECSYLISGDSIYSKLCSCRYGYIEGYATKKEYDSNSPKICIKTGDSKPKDIYKAAMVALACFMVTAIGLIVLFICNRSLFRHRHRSGFTNAEGRRVSDVFNISESLAAMRHCDKPPTYEDVLQGDRMVNGVPPPEYNATGTPETGPSTSASTPPATTGSLWRFAFINRTGSNNPAAPTDQRIQLDSERDNGDPRSRGQTNQAFISDV